MKPTKRTIDALTILADFGAEHAISASWFAQKFWPGHIMHVQVTNQGNGACAGKKAWLQAGSYLRKLENKGLVKTTQRGFYISHAGRELLKSNQK